MPLCALNAKIVGTAVSIKTSKILSLRDIIYPKLPFQPELNDLLEEHRRNNLNRPLTRRQEEVLFLLIGGLTQEQIADTLGITRGSVSNYLLSISYKFGLSTQATSKIINIGIQNGYDKCIPHNLLRPKIIMLTHEYLLETPNTNNYAIN